MLSSHNNGVPRGSETILLMDTDPEIRKLAAFMLGKQGYTVLEARTRAEAISVLERSSERIDLLMLESRGRGRELAEELKQNQPYTAVLFLCCEPAKGRQPDLEPGTFLRKPFTMSEIAGKVREVLDSRGMKTMTAGSLV
jgi:two-component system cell cycle sensor histidine kinase/response regulator CckA